MSSKTLHTLVALAGIAAASGAAWWYQHRSPASLSTARPVAPASAAPAARAASGPGDNRPVVVEVARVEAMRLVDEAQAVGNLRSRQSVVVRPEVAGRISRIQFRDGERVQRGQVLVNLDDQLPAAQVQQARAELSIAQANHQRNQDLAAQNFISARTVDESGAAVEVARAKLALADATAKRLTITAPFSGITGIRSVNVGDYLKDGADIVNLEDIDAVFVDFRLPERYLTQLRRGQQAQVALDALPGQPFAATIQAIDPLIDANGRSVGVRGCIDNRGLRLRPGMFARITTVFGVRENALVVPEEAVVPQGTKTWVVRVVPPAPATAAKPGSEGAAGTAQRVEVQLGTRRAGRVEVLTGLAAGDTVVTAGHQRIQRDGTPVKLLEAKSAQSASPSAPVPSPGAPPAAAASHPANATPLVADNSISTGGIGSFGSVPLNAIAAQPRQGANPCLATASAVSAAPTTAARRSQRGHA